MSAGTIELTNNATAVTGAGTDFTADLIAGDFIVTTVGGVTYTLPVKSIESATALTLARNYSGPDQNDAAWQAMPRGTLNLISAQIAADTAYSIRSRILEIDNWYQLLEVNDEVTIRMADGSSYTGPSWLRVIDIMNALDIDKIIPIADQIRADAAQVAEDKPVILQAKNSAETAAASAAASEKAAADSEMASASAETAAAESATAAAKSAEEAASHNPVEALVKGSNLSDLADRDEAWKNVRPTGPTNLAADPVDDLDSATMGWVKRFVASVKSVIGSWAVINNDASSPASGATALGGEITSVYQIAGVNISRMTFRAKAVIGGATGGEIVVYDDRGEGAGKSWQLPAVGGTLLGTDDIGTSGDKIPRLNATNRWSNEQEFPDTAINIGGGSSNGSGSGYWSKGRLNFKLSTDRPNPRISLYAIEDVSVRSGLRIEVTYANNRNDFNFQDNGTASGVNWQSTSEGRLKGNIRRVEKALSATLSMRGVTWDWNKKGLAGEKGVGIIAQEVEAWCKEAVSVAGAGETLSGEKVDGIRCLNVGAVAAAYHTEAIRSLFEMVKLLANGDSASVLERIAEVEAQVKPFYKDGDPQEFEASKFPLRE